MTAPTSSAARGPDAPTQPIPVPGAPSADETPLVLGRYRLGLVLGRGGMATVYRGTDVRSGRLVAIKVLAPHLAGDPQFRQRLLAEARAVAQVSHPHVVQLVEAAATDPATGATVLIMEYVPGESLAERLRRGPLSVRDAVEVAAQVAEALAFAHAQGVIHRDVKPHNILLTTPPAEHPAALVWAKLADFGIARLGNGPTTLTQAGTVMGSAPYLAPEILQGQPAGPHSDCYALGVTLFEMLAGRTPFAAETVAASLSRRLIEPAPRVRALRADVPAWLDEIVAGLLERRPAQRLTGCERLAALLRRGDDAPTLPVRLSWPAAGATDVGASPPGNAAEPSATRVLPLPRASRRAAAGPQAWSWAAWLNALPKWWRAAAASAGRLLHSRGSSFRESGGSSGVRAQGAAGGPPRWRATVERYRHAASERRLAFGLAAGLLALPLLAGVLATRPHAASEGLAVEQATAAPPAATVTANPLPTPSAAPSPTQTAAPTATRAPELVVRAPAPPPRHPPKRHEPRGKGDD